MEPPNDREQALNTFLDAVKLDKGSGTVVMDKTWYINECNRQLTDTKFYQLLNQDITADIQKRVTFYIDRMHKDKLINDKTRQ